MVSNVAEGTEKPRWWNDAEETPHVHNAVRTSWILRAEHAAGKNELHRKESGPLSDEQWGKRGWDGMENDLDYHNWNNECLLDLNAQYFGGKNKDLFKYQRKNFMNYFEFQKNV